MDELEDILRRGANDEWCLDLTDEMLAQFRRYAELLVEWNATRLNLTRITEPREIAVKHFLDSLSALRAGPLKAGARVIDVGTGAGLPGLALKIARPDLKMTLLDSTAKKIAFCRFVADELGLADVVALHARAEEAGRQPEHKAAYDVVVARAVAPLDRLLAWCEPFLRHDGVFIALKGPQAAEEAVAAELAVRRLRVRLNAPIEITLPLMSEPLTRSIVVGKRIAPSVPRRTDWRTGYEEA